MTDIVERLRGHPGAGMSVTEQFRNMVEQRHEAAAELERLRSQKAKLICEGCRRLGEVADDNARLTAALQALADDDAVPPWIRTLARRALEPQP